MTAILSTTWGGYIALVSRALTDARIIAPEDSVCILSIKLDCLGIHCRGCTEERALDCMRAAAAATNFRKARFLKTGSGEVEDESTEMNRPLKNVLEAAVAAAAARAPAPPRS